MHALAAPLDATSVNEVARVVIVEDEAIIAMDLRRQLEGFGHSVVGVAMSAEEALDSIALLRPDIVMMDIVLRGATDGVTAAQVVRQRYGLPVIYLTSHSDDATLGRATATAPYGYLLKPFRADELRAVIQVALVKHRMEMRLRESEQWFAKTLHCISDGVIATDAKGRVRFLNPAAECLTGWLHGEALGHDVREVFRVLDESSHAELSCPVDDALQERRVVGLAGSNLMLGRDGREMPIEEGAAPIVDDRGALMGAVLVFRDISERRRIERQLRESQERFHSAFDHAAIGMALVALDGRILQVNRAIGEILGRAPDELLGVSLHTLSHPADTEKGREQLTRLLADEATAVQVEKRLRHADGSTVWGLLNVALVRDDLGRAIYMIVQVQDVSARKNAEDRLHRLAHFDPLTGLLNRWQLGDAVNPLLARARRRGETLSVLFVDLDGFKLINDSLGHLAGDEALRVVAERIRRTVRESDIVVRWGGDEFVVVASEAHSESSAREMAARIREVVSRPIPTGQQETWITASVGIALYPRDGDNLASLLAGADSAMYRAKELGKNQSRFANGPATTDTIERLRLEHELRHALAAGELTVHYQAIVAKNGAHTVEALLRWPHPRRGLVPPSEFIPLAERCGLIVPIGAWVLRVACAQVQRWRETGFPDLRVAVNLSPRQFRDPDLIDTIDAALHESRLDPSALELEITESIMSNPQAAAVTLAKLHAQGVHISLDDFGTGYSSLSHLRRFPLQRVKVDRSFVADVPGSPGGEAIIQGIVGLAHNLGLQVVAEGVETSAQSDFLQAIGCDALQGFLFHHPGGADDVASVLTDLAFPALSRDQP